LRGFCRWLVRRGLLALEPTDGDEIRVSLGARLDVPAFTADQVEGLLEAAENPPPASRTAWRARDVALVSVLADWGLRVSELCALTLASLEPNKELPLVRVRHGAKGGKLRNVPSPSEHVRIGRASRGGPGGPRALLFVRPTGQPLNQQFVDTLLRRLCASTPSALRASL